MSTPTTAPNGDPELEIVVTAPLLAPDPSTDPTPPAAPATVAAPPPAVQVVWTKLIPGVAITLQVGFDNFFSGLYGGATTAAAATGLVPTTTAIHNATNVLVPVMVCTNGTERALRSTTFAIVAVVGWMLMKWSRFDDQRLIFHWIINLLVIPCWLLSISAFPLTCWIASPLGTPLTGHQVTVISYVRFMLIALVPVLAGIEVNKDKFAVPDVVANAPSRVVAAVCEALCMCGARTHVYNDDDAATVYGVDCDDRAVVRVRWDDDAPTNDEERRCAAPGGSPRGEDDDDTDTNANLPDPDVVRANDVEEARNEGTGS